MLCKHFILDADDDQWWKYQKKQHKVFCVYTFGNQFGVTVHLHNSSSNYALAFTEEEGEKEKKERMAHQRRKREKDIW